MSSKAEEITTEVRKLVMMYRTAESQLAQSIPRKEHDVVVTKLQDRIGGLEAELVKTKLEFERSTSIGTRIEEMKNQIMTQNEIVAAQNKLIEQLTSKVAEDVVPTKVYETSLSHIQELEQKASSMVEKDHYESLVKRYAELESRVLSSMVPREEYKALETKLADSVPKALYENLQKTIEQTMVPLERYQSAEKRLNELESVLAESIPRADFEGLVDSLGRIAKEAVVVPNSTSSTTGAAISSSAGEKTHSSSAVVSSQPDPQALEQAVTPSAPIAT